MAKKMGGSVSNAVTMRANDEMQNKTWYEIGRFYIRYVIGRKIIIYWT